MFSSPMTDKAPERIWVHPDPIYQESEWHPRVVGYDWSEGVFNSEEGMYPHEYVRADRIEELEAELHLMKTSGIVEVAVRNPSVMEYMQHWEGRAETAEAKLAKAVEALGRIQHESYGKNAAIARTTLAEITGEQHD